MTMTILMVPASCGIMSKNLSCFWPLKRVAVATVAHALCRHLPMRDLLLAARHVGRSWNALSAESVEIGGLHGNV